MDESMDDDAKLRQALSLRDAPAGDRAFAADVMRKARALRRRHFFLLAAMLGAGSVSGVFLLEPLRARAFDAFGQLALRISGGGEVLAAAAGIFVAACIILIAALAAQRR